LRRTQITVVERMRRGPAEDWDSEESEPRELRMDMLTSVYRGRIPCGPAWSFSGKVIIWPEIAQQKAPQRGGLWENSGKLIENEDDGFRGYGIAFSGAASIQQRVAEAER
jgi:hypothetical protein